jgi:energy-coupling factor transport system permease protein
LALVVLVSAAVMSPTGLRFVPAAVALGAGLAVAERAWRRGGGLVLAAAGLWLGGWPLPAAWPGAVTAVVALACQFTIRLVACVGVGWHVIGQSSPTAMSAALRAWRAPRAIAVTLAVMLRFFPVVVGEARAVADAMRLRGLAGGRGLLRHPWLSLERFAVPMTAASLRATEDLSASAALRGLGSRRRPTAMFPLRFGAADLMLALAVAALAAASLAASALLAPWWLA